MLTDSSSNSNSNNFAAAFARIDVPRDIDERAALLVQDNPIFVAKEQQRATRNNELNEAIARDDWARNIR